MSVYIYIKDRPHQIIQLVDQNAHTHMDGWVDGGDLRVIQYSTKTDTNSRGITEHVYVSFVRCARYQKKRYQGKACLYLTKESKTLYQGQRSRLQQTNMLHRRRYCIINNVTFAKENMNKTLEAIEN